MTTEAPATGSELDLLLGYLAQQRYAIRLTAYGLTDEQARETPTKSTLSVGGLIKHTTTIETEWLRTVQRNATPFDELLPQLEINFTLLAEESLTELFGAQELQAAETERVVRAIGDLAHPVPVPKDVPWHPKDLDAWSLRWVLLHLVEEIARHAGHADLIREHLDGATTFPLRAAAEGWPANDFVQPWQPARPGE